MYCSVQGCPLAGPLPIARPKGVSMHQFPRDPSLCTQWINSIHTLNRQVFVKFCGGRVCSQHFHKHEVLHNFGRTNLALNAVPTLFATNNYSADPLELYETNSDVVELDVRLLTSDAYDNDDECESIEYLDDDNDGCDGDTETSIDETDRHVKPIQFILCGVDGNKQLNPINAKLKFDPKTMPIKLMGSSTPDGIIDLKNYNTANAIPHSSIQKSPIKKTTIIEKSNVLKLSSQPMNRTDSDHRILPVSQAFANERMCRLINVTHASTTVASSRNTLERLRGLVKQNSKEILKYRKQSRRYKHKMALLKNELTELRLKLATSVC